MCSTWVKRLNSLAVILKLVGGIEPNKCHAGMHQTLSYKQKQIRKILMGGRCFELG